MGMRLSGCCMIAAVLGVGLTAASCSSDAAPAAATPITLPSGFSVPQINFDTLATATTVLDCDAVISEFAALQLDTNDLISRVRAVIAKLGPTAPPDVSQALTSISAAIGKLPTSAAPGVLLADPAVARALGTVQAFVQSQCS